MNALQVQVVNSYKIGLVVNGVPVPDSGGQLMLQPSIQACGQLSTSTPGATPVQIQCLNASDLSVSTTGCQNFILDLSQGQNNGGHNHNDTDDTRPFVLNSAASTFPVGSYQTFDSTGNAFLGYVPPEVAGDIILDVAGTDASGNVIRGPSYKFSIQDTSLGTLVDLDGTGLGLGPVGNNPGIMVSATSHPGAGSFGTQAMQAQVAALVKGYYQLGDDHGFTNLTPLKSESASMVYGGLFDANWNGGINSFFITPWGPPHCGHRNGVTIDLSINTLDSDERDWLAQAATDVGFGFTSPAAGARSV